MTWLMFGSLALGAALLARSSVDFYGAHPKIRLGFAVWYALALLVSLAFALHAEWSFPALLLPGAVVGATLTLTLLAQKHPLFVRGSDGKPFARRYRLQIWRAYFGGVIVLTAFVGLAPSAFAVSAGLGDLAVGLFAWGLSWRKSQRAAIAVAFVAMGVVDLLNALRLAATVVLPWLVENRRPGVLLMLPLFVVPQLLSHHIQMLLALPSSRQPQDSVVA